jgi:hypothetical protein
VCEASVDVVDDEYDYYFAMTVLVVQIATRRCHCHFFE